MVILRFLPIVTDVVVFELILKKSSSKLETDDCRRVLTTSNGQVAMAPNVPPSL